MKPILNFLAVLMLFFFTSTALAFQWDIDPDHSEIRFAVKHIHTTVSGQFSDFKGDIFFNPDDPGQGRFDFTIKVKSVNTNNGKRDNHLRSKDFFDADQFPDMTFVSSTITPLTDNRYALEGMMTIKDVTQKMTVEVVFFEPKPHPFDAKKWVAGFTTAFVIPRIDFHVGDGKFLKMGVVGNEVDVTISVEALRSR